MKNILLIILFVSSFIACNKEDDFTSSLEGYWLLTEITGGFAGTGYTASFDHLQIDKGEKYALMIQDAVIQEGTYEWSEESENLIIRFIPNVNDTIAFDNEEKTVVFSQGDKNMTLSDPCCDLFVYTFEKEK